MATFFDLCPNTNFFEPECFFTIMDYYPLYLTFVTWTLSFVTGSIWAYLMGFGITLDQLINLGLRYAINQNGLHGIEHQMPARASQLAAFYITTLIYLILIYRVRVSTYNITLLALVQLLVVYARIYLEINTNSQIIVGAAVGIADSSVQNFLFYWLVYSNLESIKQSKIYQWMGFTTKYMHVFDDYDGDYEVNTKINRLIFASGFYDRYELKDFVNKAVPDDGKDHHSPDLPIDPV